MESASVGVAPVPGALPATALLAGVADVVAWLAEPHPATAAQRMAKITTDFLRAVRTVKAVLFLVEATIPVLGNGVSTS
jgi:hypothetical protein